jgi:hypothetical protein
MTYYFFLTGITAREYFLLVGFFFIEYKNNMYNHQQTITLNAEPMKI